MLEGCYKHAMANLQVKNVPESLHRRLRLFAERADRTVRDIVLEAVTKHVGQLEFQARLAKRSRVSLGHPVARSLEEVRLHRDEDLSR